jgi:Ca2+-transporting ATPase
MALSHVWKCADNSLVASAKGAPEAIADLCHLNPSEQKNLQKNIDILAKDGLRVLGVARSTVRGDKLPQSQHDFNFEFVGLVGWADPVRSGIREAISECHDAGIRVIMITGDYPVTAGNIASQIGLINSDQVITGQELLTMSAKILEEKIKEVNIFSRVLPDQKLLIVNAIKTGGNVVAMTGDGVNDAPALKAAHIGIAMGERGTDVAREAADLVLLDDDFYSIVKAIRLGRRIFDNLKKAIAYIISVHVPIAGAALVPVFMGWPIILYPAHIVFLELVIDPACSLVFEAEAQEPGIMHRAPRPARSRLFTPKLVLLSVFQGLFSMVAALTIFKVSLMFGDTTETARTLSFGTLIVSNICLILTNRSWHKSILETFRNTNRALFFVVSGAIVSLALTIYVPFLRKLFHFSRIHNDDILIFVAAGFLSVVWFELIKFFARRANFELMS